MFRSPRQTSTARTPRLAISIALVTALLTLLATASVAGDELRAAALLPRADEDRRPTGIAYVDLPLRWRARFDAAYTNNFYPSDGLARPYAAAVGPSLDRNHSLESRIAIARPLTDRIELELAWGARSRLGSADLLDFDRQTVGAVIRIIP
jgi:hypothetical protein